MQTQTSLAGENGGELSSFYASQHFEGGSVRFALNVDV